MTKKWIVRISAVAAVVYAAMVPLATSGYGYMGYYGYDNNASFLYWNDTIYYANKDLRQGSQSGTSVRGKGPGQGK